ncbi:MAG: hypothetical protein H7Y07_10075 [Pyrinomonadaceae bacterium]|nr:hypothetical protein [Sphingobacteriaceae bacterium]
MKKTALYLIVLAISITACNTANQKSESSDSADNTVKDDLITGNVSSDCYAYKNNKDSVYMHFKDSAGLISGNLNYNFYEKDSNKGTINGHMKGDTLVADYTFMSEGVESVRQVAFLKKGTDFVEGYADVEEKNGKMVFKSLDSLKFGNMALSRAECKE